MGLRDRIKQAARRALKREGAGRPSSPRASAPAVPPAWPGRERARAPDADTPAAPAAPPDWGAPTPAEPAGPPDWGTEAVAEEAAAEPDGTVDAEPGRGEYRVRLVNDEEGLDRTIVVYEAETILDAAAREGIELPYSCLNGGCFMCTGKLLEGEMEMGEQFMLEEEQIARGYRLLCCSWVTSDAVILTHQAEEVT